MFAVVELAFVDHRVPKVELRADGLRGELGAVK